MNAIVQRIQVGIATCAIATAAVLTPTGVAKADPAPPMPLAGLGSSLSDCDEVDTLSCVLAPGISANFAGPHSILQNSLWWFGTPNPNPPTRTTVFQFYPLALIPGFLKPFFGWFSAVNLEFCIAGLTLRIGPYGAVSGSYGRGCA